jgi:hypothetical protein
VTDGDSVPGLPFGGVGASGSTSFNLWNHPQYFLSAFANQGGGYHTGKYSFDLFTHQRSTFTMPNWYVRVTVTRKTC